MKSSVAWELNSDKEVKSARKDKGKEVKIFNIDTNYNIGYRKSRPSQVTVSQNQFTASLSYVSCLSCLYSLLSFFSFCQASPFHISCTSCLNCLSSLTCLSYLYFFSSPSWSQIMEVMQVFRRVMSIPHICHFFTQSKFLKNEIYTEKTRKLRQNIQKIANFLAYYGKIHSKLPIFRV